LRWKASGLNGIVQSIWYLIWSILATDRKGASSEYCVASDNDPCLYPAVSTRIDNRTAVAALATAFKSGLFDAFDLDSVITPPVMEFTADGIQGSTSADLILVGVTDNSTSSLQTTTWSRLASLKSGVMFKASFPKFDRASGTFSPLRFDLSIDPPEVESFQDEENAPRLVLLQKVLDAVHGVLHVVLDRVLTNLNTGLEEFFSEIVIEPPEPIYVAPNLFARFGFSNETRIFWQPGTELVQGVVGLSLGVSLKVEPTAPSS
jgi:hypothetical protein